MRFQQPADVHCKLEQREKHPDKHLVSHAFVFFPRIKRALCYAPQQKTAINYLIYNQFSLLENSSAIFFSQLIIEPSSLHRIPAKKVMRNTFSRIIFI